MRAWLAEHRMGTLLVVPGSPWENACIKLFNNRLRNELLRVEMFGTMKVAQALAEQHRFQYNCHRPHSELRRRTPAFAVAYIPPAMSPPLEQTSTDVVDALLTPGT
jgi:putative transposase